MKNQRSNKLYNYLVNTYGLSKSLVMEYVEERLEELISKHITDLLQSNRIERMIIHMVAEYIKTGKIDYWVKQKSFESIVDEQIRKVVEDQVRKRCRIIFQFDSNSVKFATED